MTKQFNQVRDEIQLNKINLESKVGEYQLVAKTVEMQGNSIERLENMIISTKGSLIEEFNKLREHFSESVIKVDQKSSEI